MGKILPQIDHIIVVMLENRSLDNLCGWLYSDALPSNFIGHFGSDPSIAPRYDGLNAGLWNPSNYSYFKGDPPEKVFVVKGASSTTVPNPDPEEKFAHITFQLYGPDGPAPNPRFPMQGFLVDYKGTGASNPNQIMECYTPDQVPVMSALARNFAISDRWFCSTPNQTWPNRSFVHAGTANGHVNNTTWGTGKLSEILEYLPNPVHWDVPTIFDVLEKMHVSWKVYSNTYLTSSLTRSMSPHLWGLPNPYGHFEWFPEFQHACSKGSLPSYSFIEPSFLSDPDDQHPPHDVTAGEEFLWKIWKAVSQSPKWSKILLVITYDEHGGCYDHVLPPTNAVTPDQASNPGRECFYFDRFGVRVPTILVSPYIEPGTVFRAGLGTPPYDHTSILATIRDWLAIPDSVMLPSKRIAAAPHLGPVLTRTTPRPDLPTIPSPAPRSPHVQSRAMSSQPINDLQMSLLSASAIRLGLSPSEVVKSTRTVHDALNFFEQQRGDLTGEWVVDDAVNSYAAHLTQQGTKVSGTYDFQGGTLEGTVEGRTAKLRWDQPGNRRGGPTEMTIAPDGQSMTGTWTRDPTVYNSGLTGSGTWTFRRKSPPATGEATTTAGPAVPSEVAPEGAAPSVQFLSGSFATWRGQDAGWSLDQGIGEREFVKHVAFSKRFDAPPQVVVELSGLDVDPRKVTRVDVAARNVTPEGFDLILRTWSDSIVNSVGANWLALESGRGALSGESFGTARTEVAAWKLVQGVGEREYVKHVTFSKRFDTPPQVVVGSSLLDVDQSKNTRVEVSARDVTPEGFDLVLKTWFDSIVYNLGANWLALEPGRVALSAGSLVSARTEGAAWKLDQGMGEREYVKHVTFSKRFDAPPQVVVGLSLLDVDQSKNTRVAISARDVTPEGFDLVLKTWFDTIIYNLGANWLALAPPRPHSLTSRR